MAETFDVTIDGKTYKATPNSDNMTVFIDGDPYIISFQPDGSYSVSAGSESFRINSKSIIESARSGVCMECHGTITCSSGDCVTTACGTFCR